MSVPETIFPPKISQDLQKNIDQVFVSQLDGSIFLRASSYADRIKRLDKFRKALVSYQREIIAAGAKDFGKPEKEVEMGEILPLILELDDTRKHLKKWLKPKSVAATAMTLGTKSFIKYEPLGRCLIISPWNYPVLLTFGPMIAAISAGNAVIIKTSELTPNLSSVMVKIVEAAFELSEVAIFEGESSVATALLSLPFDHMFFTGSTAVGRVVMAAAANHLSRVTLELGGKSPVIIDQSADLALAARTISGGKFFNAGQTCVAPDHVYVHHSVYEEFVQLLRDAIVEGFGEGASAKSPGYARIVNKRHMERLSMLYNDALNLGATVIEGGDMDSEECFISPTLLADVPQGACIMEQEIFGPILPILTYTEINHVIANLSVRARPLAIYLWSRDKHVNESVISHTHSGAVCINQGATHFIQHRLPFGGVGESGMGNYHGEFGIREFSYERPVMETTLMLSTLFLPPLSNRAQKIVKWLISKK